jgi:uncharacterized protein (TIRG00374 family)
MRKKRLLFIFKIIASLVAIGVIFWQIDLRSFVQAFSRANAALLCLVFLLALMLQAVNAIKIKLLLPGLPIGFRYILLTNFVATFLRLTIPTDLGAELGRGYYFSRKTGSPAASFSAIVLDRYSGLFSQCAVLAGAALLFGLTGHDRFWISIGIAASSGALLMAGLLVVFSRLPVIKRSSRKGFIRITHALSRFSDYARRFRAMPLRVIAVALISIGSHCATLIMIMVTSAAYHVSLQFHEAAAIALSSTIGFVVPVTVAGLGIIEGIYAGLFALFSLQKEIGVAVSLTMRVIALLMALPGVLFFIYGDRLVKGWRRKS